MLSNVSVKLYVSESRASPVAVTRNVTAFWFHACSGRLMLMGFATFAVMSHVAPGMSVKFVPSVEYIAL